MNQPQHKSTRDTTSKRHFRTSTRSVLILFGLIILALIPVVTGDVAQRHIAWLQHNSILQAQETIMRATEQRWIRELFGLDPGERRSFRLTATAYCPLCGVPDGEPQLAALGGLVRPGRTVAVSQDLRHLLGRKVYIKGFGLRVVEDLMHPRYSARLDLCLQDHKQAQAFGVKRLDMVVVD